MDKGCGIPVFRQRAIAHPGVRRIRSAQGFPAAEFRMHLLSEAGLFSILPADSMLIIRQKEAVHSIHDIK
jgi:hypothetical protein